MGQEVGHTGRYEPWHVSLKPLIFPVWLLISWWLVDYNGGSSLPQGNWWLGEGWAAGVRSWLQRTHSREGLVECGWGQQGREEPICQHWACQTQPSQLVPHIFPGEASWWRACRYCPGHSWG